MSKAPEVCLYCKGTGEGPGAPCGFCENGTPLDTQEDWDRTWGRIFDMLFNNRNTPCRESLVSSRVCEKGTKGCVIRHDL